MNRLAKLLKFIGDAVLIAVVVLLAAATIVTVSARLNGTASPAWFGFRIGRVITGSMEPEIPVGSMVVAKAVDTAELAVGDDIMFVSDDPTVPNGAPVTHRIVRVEVDDQHTRSFITKGVANDTEDDYPVSENQVLGQIVWVSETAGQVILWFQKPWIYPVLIGILLLDLIWNIAVVAKLSVNSAQDPQENS